MKNFLSVLTPTWNRAKYLDRVYWGLENQTLKIFEWIVVDDGSDDDTEKVMRKIMDRASFPVTYVRFPVRVGKIKADNTLLDLAKFDFITWCDSDDAFTPTAIERFYSAWQHLSVSDQNKCIGILGLCEDIRGRLQNSGGGEFQPFMVEFGKLGSSRGISNDTSIFFRREKIGYKRFPEVDLVMTEAGFWAQFMDLHLYCLPDVFKIMIRDTENRISGSKKMEYCRGKAYAIAMADAPLYFELRFFKQIQIANKYHRYCVHGDLDLSTRNELFKANKNMAYFLGCFVGSLLAFKDFLLGRVLKTHKLSELNSKAVPVIYSNNYS